MRGGAQAHLMRCSDDNYYVVKFQNNPQHRRVLVNEMLGTRLASRLGLPAAPVSVVEVPEELIRLTAELCFETPRTRVPCTPGQQFASRYPGDPRRVALHDFLPDEKLCEVDNLHDFAGMLVFDKWTCNTNGRQTVFFETRRRIAAFSPESTGTVGRGTGRRRGRPGGLSHGDDRPGILLQRRGMEFSGSPLRGLYARNRVYEGVIGMDSFAPWLERLERQISERVLAELSEEIPPAWYEDDYDAMVRLLEQVYRRKQRVPELLLSAQKSNRVPFAYWRT